MVGVRQILTPSWAADYFDAKELALGERRGIALGNWRALDAAGLTKAASATTPAHIARLLHRSHAVDSTPLAKKWASTVAGSEVLVAPDKTISVAGLLGDEQTRELVQDALAKATLNVGAWLMEQCPDESSPVQVHFRHTTNRAKEPHLHTHIIIPNLGFDLTRDGAPSARALNARTFYVQQKSAEALFECSLVGELRRRGIASSFEQGKACIPALKPLAERFSTPSATIAATSRGDWRKNRPKKESTHSFETDQDFKPDAILAAPEAPDLTIALNRGTPKAVISAQIEHRALSLHQKSEPYFLAINILCEGEAMREAPETSSDHWESIPRVALPQDELAAWTLEEMEELETLRALGQKGIRASPRAENMHNSI